jgi:hypothetical protein
VTPAPSLTEIIDAIRADSPSTDPVEQLVTAAQMVAAIGEISDSALGFFVDQCRRSGRSWTEISSALGVTKQAAHKRFSPAVSLERFTARARALLEHSVAEAVRLRHHYVGTEHVLLGLMADAESLASKVLAETSITRGIVEERVLQVTPRGSIAVDAPPFTPRASRCIENALSEALQLGHNYIGTEHILLALFDDPEGLAAKILAQLGATYDDVHAAVIKQLSGYVS